MDGYVATTGTVVHDHGHARTVLSRIKHHYGACEAELGRYANLVRDQLDPAGILLWCERRLESVVRRAGFVPTRPEARRAIVRGHVLVNGRKVIHPGYLVRAGDVLTIRPRPHIQTLYRPRLKGVVHLPSAWLRVEPESLRATVARLPAPADIGLRVDVTGMLENLLH
jgi:small subunit ribosomal protein S4